MYSCIVRWHSCFGISTVATSRSRILFGARNRGKRIADQLKSAVETRLNILVSGGTRTGRTTLLNALGKFIPSDERAFVIENAPEIHMGQDSLIRFEARRPQQGPPPVPLRDFLDASLRARLHPDDLPANFIGAYMT